VRCLERREVPPLREPTRSPGERGEKASVRSGRNDSLQTLANIRGLGNQDSAVKAALECRTPYRSRRGSVAKADRVAAVLRESGGDWQGEKLPVDGLVTTAQIEVWRIGRRGLRKVNVELGARVE
jgi:hypothetical protein